MTSRRTIHNAQGAMVMADDQDQDRFTLCLRRFQQTDKLLKAFTRGYMVQFESSWPYYRWWHRASVVYAKDLRSVAEDDYYAALSWEINYLWREVVRNVDPWTFNSAGDLGWESEITYPSFESMLAILDLDDNGQHGHSRTQNTDDPKKPIQVHAELDITHEVLIEWDQARQVVKLSGTMSVAKHRNKTIRRMLGCRVNWRRDWLELDIE
ncbi:hypothetical protein QBC44DRAFT_373214 [Cladorrhinum sp. PSN332]|nr:hypothetical protein QBC44DRAFT_373214 [Cladorrhinum sp. PSN332]